MKYHLETLSPVLRKLCATLPVHLVNTALADHKQKNKASSLQAAAEALISETIFEVLEREQLHIFGEVQVEKGQIVSDEPFSFAVCFEALPEIAVPTDLAKLEIEVPSPSLDINALQDITRKLLLQDAPCREVLDHPQNGDLAVIDMQGSIAGRPAPSLTFQRRRFELRPDGAATNAYGLDISAIVRTMQPGETKHGSSYYPESSPNMFLRGKTIEYSMHLHNLSRPLLPAFDDSFAQKKGFDSLSAFKNFLLSKLMGLQLAEIRKSGQHRLLEKTIAEQDIPLPPALVRMYQQEHLDEAQDKLRAYGLDKESLPAELQLLSGQLTEKAEKNAREELFLLAIADRAQLTVSDAEVQEYLKSIAEEGSQDHAYLKKSLKEYGMFSELYHRLLAKKALDHLYDSAHKNVLNGADPLPSQIRP